MKYNTNAPILLRTEDVCVTFCRDTHALAVQAAGVLWQTDSTVQPAIVCEKDGVSYSALLQQAHNVVVRTVHSATGQGIEVRYTGFPFDAQLAFCTYWWLETTTGTLRAAVRPVCDGAVHITALHWPAPFLFDTLCEEHVTVVPLMQGVLIPNGWPQAFDLESRWELEAQHYYTRSAYLPWWGQLRGAQGYLAIAETPDDGGFAVVHPARGVTSVRPVWHGSLGRLSYARVLAYRFYSACSYVTLCKEYRAYVKSTGRLTTLREKALKNPLVEKLFGAAVVHTGISLRPHTDCRFYGTPNAPAYEVSFAQRAQQLQALHARGLRQAYVHVDGWIHMGYDSQHPDVLPPCPAAGGFAGLRALQAAVQGCGWLFALHDQYRDYYLDAPSYTPALAKKGSDGSIPLCDFWAGGRQAILCPSQALGFVRRNYTLLEQAGVKPDGVYLDVFACVGLEECWDEVHLVTRAECLSHREVCFEEIRARGIIISSEEGIGWAMHSLDLVHHANYAMVMEADSTTLCGCPTGVAYGIPVPLLNLVYHDCVVTPWYITDADSEMPRGQSGLLHAVLNAGVPYVSVEADTAALAQAQEVCDVHRRLACCEMVEHKLLDAQGVRQQARYSDGTVITVDFSLQTWKLEL